MGFIYVISLIYMIFALLYGSGENETGKRIIWISSAFISGINIIMIFCQVYSDSFFVNLLLLILPVIYLLIFLLYESDSKNPENNHKKPKAKKEPPKPFFTDVVVEDESGGVYTIKKEQINSQQMQSPMNPGYGYPQQRGIMTNNNPNWNNQNAYNPPYGYPPQSSNAFNPNPNFNPNLNNQQRFYPPYGYPQQNEFQAQNNYQVPSQNKNINMSDYSQPVVNNNSGVVNNTPKNSRINHRESALDGFGKCEVDEFEDGTVKITMHHEKGKYYYYVRGGNIIAYKTDKISQARQY